MQEKDLSLSYATDSGLVAKPALNAILCFIILFPAAYFLYYTWSNSLIVPDKFNLTRWDTVWYQIIAEEGYYWDPHHTNPMAFFPLFPFMWKITGLNAIGISLLNSGLFLTSFGILATHLKLNFRQCLLFISTPCLVFCMLPYSEGLFFACSVFLLIGLDRSNNKLILIGMLLAALTRSISMVFFASLVFIWLVRGNRHDANQRLKSLGMYAALLTGVMFAVFYIQYLSSGEWAMFFKAQQLWNRHLSFPKLPFSTVNGSKILWMDGLGLFVSIIAGICCIMAIWSRYIQKKAVATGEGILFSMGFLVLAGFLAVFYSGVLRAGEGTNLMSLNRFVFASPFYIVFATYLIRNRPFRNWEVPILTTCFIIVCLLLGAYRKLKWHSSIYVTALYFSKVTVYFLSVLLCDQIRWMYYVAAIIQLFIGIHLYHEFLRRNWIG